MRGGWHWPYRRHWAADSLWWLWCQTVTGKTRFCHHVAGITGKASLSGNLSVAPCSGKSWHPPAPGEGEAAAKTFQYFRQKAKAFLTAKKEERKAVGVQAVDASMKMHGVSGASTGGGGGGGASSGQGSGGSKAAAAWSGPKGQLGGSQTSSGPKGQSIGSSQYYFPLLPLRLNMLHPTQPNHHQPPLPTATRQSPHH